MIGEAGKPTLGLLELISFKTGCMYLSDLHQSHQLLFIQHAIREIPVEEFSLQEWNDAVEYITGEKVCFSGQKQAALFLQHHKTSGRGVI